MRTQGGDRPVALRRPESYGKSYDRGPLPSLRGGQVDHTDLMILRTLQDNGRISKSALAAEVDLSPSACIERMRALERKKLIISYHARINLGRLAPIEHFFTAIALRNHRYYDVVRFESYARDCQRIMECFALGGGIDYLLRIMAANVGCYQAFMDELLQADIGIDRYTTYICTKQVKDRCLAPISAVPVA